MNVAHDIGPLGKISCYLFSGAVVKIFDAGISFQKCFPETHIHVQHSHMVSIPIPWVEQEHSGHHAFL